RFRSGNVDHPPGRADPRWHGLFQGNAAGAVFPRCQDHRDLRGHVGNPAHGDRAQRDGSSLTPTRSSVGWAEPALLPVKPNMVRSNVGLPPMEPASAQPTWYEGHVRLRCGSASTVMNCGSSPSSLSAVSLPPHTQPVSMAYMPRPANRPSADQCPHTMRVSRVFTPGTSNHGYRPARCEPGAPFASKSMRPFASQ